MIIRKTTLEDLDSVMEIYAYARKFMSGSGNSHQWINNYPQIDIIKDDINQGVSYVVTEQDKIFGVFSFFLGEDETYHYIEGKWLNDEPYGTIHRIASNGQRKEILKTCIDYCLKIVNNVRIDTHEDNKVMQHLLEKYGFKKCGIIYLKDGRPRLAYHLTSLT